MQKIEQQLIKGIMSQDKGSFDILFRTYYGKLLSIATNILHDKQLAEEAAQDVFIKLWQSGSDLSIDTSLNSYMISMVHNRCIDYIRMNERRIKTVSIENQEVQQKLHEIGIEAIEEELFSVSLEVVLKQTIDDLPVHCKEIFSLSRFDGLSNKEISEKLQLSVSTVKTQIARALKKLKEVVYEQK